MITTVITLDRGTNTVDIELEFRYSFIREVLQSMGLPIDDIWIEPILSAEQRLKLVHLLNKYNISIFEDIDGNVEVLYEKEVIGIWKTPIFSFCRDLKIEDKEKSIYLEMTTNYWSPYHDGKDE